MQTFTVVTGKVAPMMDANIDTDVIMPKQFLKGIDRQNLDRGLFFDLRLLPDGQPNPEFILNRPEWHGSSFMVVGPNFGCGSSREHAVWGLQQTGIRALIGTSFAGIFADNCQRNGVLLICLTPEQVAEVAAVAGEPQHNTISIDLSVQQIQLDDGRVIGFKLDERNRLALMKGLDAIGVTMEYQGEIRDFEKRYGVGNPWLGIN
ncbi:3-isopropylmalate dehydratase small subunit [Budviciaceae bacterium CWB-B4]|uniref:3-isopropylmalate dehydratase small subunit n=1 Tax=Limnobaculum xujianqingii TaxID=2738837 RepID=A0A9D7FV06_9GAMM|nr:3-isopropylmalate dehydratase small subunit [Limnobaculum xujianqingii]MBK5074129.1 3-isopropylmalate dehydratase small subunit [Limnobaculum xujianqingii]MBK5177438.1 3-isopropylmalate dehydratase small subunit [Limnobaculum xujianqingii]